MSVLGHNGGPTMEPGFGFRKHAWGKARKSLMKTLPIEILRVRVARAKRLGIEYKTYASIRAASGHDVVAFLFSGNALELRRARAAIPDAKAARLIDLDGAVTRVGAIYAATNASAVQAANPNCLDVFAAAPGFNESWSASRAKLTAILREHNLPKDGVVLVPATSVEQEWCLAGKLAGSIPAERFFQAVTQ